MILTTETLQEVESQLFDHLNYSILTGEYVNDISTKDKLTRLNEIILKLLEVPELNNTKLFDDYTFFAKRAKLAVSIFSEFITNVYRKFEFFSKQYILRYNDGLLYIDEDLKSKDIELFCANILVAELDHNLSRNNLKQLIEISNTISNKLNEKYMPL